MNLELVKSTMFGEVECDIYKQEEEMFMTGTQLGECLGYSNPRVSISNLVNRFDYLKNVEFSGVTKLMTPSGEQETRVFNEDGIYEITMLAKTEKAKEFRRFIRGVLKGLRQGNYRLTGEEQMLKIKKQNAEARLKNAKVKEANFIITTLEKYEKTLSLPSKNLLVINALETVVGKNKLPRPELSERYYSATDIAREFGVSVNLIGKIANLNGIKNEEYGMYVLDKAKYNDAQVTVFRYNERGKKKIQELLNNF